MTKNTTATTSTCGADSNSMASVLSTVETTIQEYLVTGKSWSDINLHTNSNAAAHGILITGPTGSGKTHLARIIAQVMLLLQIFRAMSLYSILSSNRN